MTRHARLLALARARGDLLAIAVLEGGRTYRPWPDYRIFVGIHRWASATGLTLLASGVSMSAMRQTSDA